MYNPTHKPNDGNELLICQMTDSHLKYTINLFIKRAEDSLRKMDEIGSKSFQGYLKHSMGQEKAALIEEEVETHGRIMKWLEPYILDAARRGFVLKDQLERATGIKGQEESTPLKVLTESESTKQYRFDHAVPPLAEEDRIRLYEPYRNAFGKIRRSDIGLNEDDSSSNTTGRYYGDSLGNIADNHGVDIYEDDEWSDARYYHEERGSI